MSLSRTWLKLGLLAGVALVSTVPTWIAIRRESKAKQGTCQNEWELVDKARDTGIRTQIFGATRQFNECYYSLVYRIEK